MKTFILKCWARTSVSGAGRQLNGDAQRVSVHFRRRSGLIEDLVSAVSLRSCRGLFICLFVYLLSAAALRHHASITALDDLILTSGSCLLIDISSRYEPITVKTETTVSNQHRVFLFTFFSPNHE